jgi:hypothetical protein
MDLLEPAGPIGWRKQIEELMLAELQPDVPPNWKKAMNQRILIPR